jgi:hypothetical protein
MRRPSCRSVNLIATISLRERRAGSRLPASAVLYPANATRQTPRVCCQDFGARDQVCADWLDTVQLYGYPKARSNERGK